VAAPVLLRTENLRRSFGQLAAVDGVDFEVPAGELRAVIGPNGAGKSTFFKLISGELAPTAGRIVFDGRDITGLPHHTVSRRGIAKSYQITTVFQQLTVIENVRVAVQCRRTILDCWRAAAAPKWSAGAEAMHMKAATADVDHAAGGNRNHGQGGSGIWWVG
jgi:branched-chain amino acid transport system ATP-binding protein